MNLLKKISWIVPAILISTALFAESQNISNYCDPCPKEPPECDPCYEQSRDKPYDQGYKICEGALPKAYNAPARIDICDGWDTYVTGSFIYWEVLDEQTDLGITETSAVVPIVYEVVKFPTSYELGFKVGLGTHFSSNDWDLYAQYTRLHETESTNYDPNGKIGFIFSSWVERISNGHNLVLLSDVKASNKFDLDKIDLELGRSYYVGQSLTIRPFIGGSAHWLDQNYTFDLIFKSGAEYRNFYKNDSWSIGPRFGIGSNWLFYEGFRLFGFGAFSLLYSDNDSTGDGVEAFLTYNITKVSKKILRDVEELMIGLGWGSYFCSDKWHFDLSVAYEAQRYASTNYMAQLSQMRNISNISASTTTNIIKPGDSFLHGLTVSARIDF